MKIFLKSGFIPVDKSVFKVGLKIDFNCYIQRFNGYAIIIEAGTVLDEKLHKIITRKNLQIFVEQANYDDYKEYAKENKDFNVIALAALVLDQEIKKSLEIEQPLSQETLASEKLKLIYNQGKNLINAWLLEKENRQIPIKAFDCLAENIVMIIYDNKVTLSGLNQFLDGKYSLASHLLNVAFFSSLLANEIDLDLEDKRKLVLSALLHDIGKIGIDETLIDKPDYLTEDEFETIKKHAVESILLIKRAGVKDRLIIESIRHHHERLDGSGYPEGIKEKRISQFGQIVGICDVFDALITIKPYRGAYSTYNALTLIGKEYKNKLNMKYVNIFIKLLK